MILDLYGVCASFVIKRGRHSLQISLRGIRAKHCRAEGFYPSFVKHMFYDTVDCLTLAGGRYCTAG